MKKGEIPGVRRTMDRFTKQLIKNGMPPSKAKQKAQTAAVRHDRMRRQGRLNKPKDES